MGQWVLTLLLVTPAAQLPKATCLLSRGHRELLSVPRSQCVWGVCAVLRRCCTGGLVIHSRALCLSGPGPGFWEKCKDIEVLEVPQGDVVPVFPFHFTSLWSLDLFDNFRTFPKQHEVWVSYNQDLCRLEWQHLGLETSALREKTGTRDTLVSSWDSTSQFGVHNMVVMVGLVGGEGGFTVWPSIISTH